MIKSSLKLLVSAALLVTIGCSKDDDSAPAPVVEPPIGKPLPNDCFSTLEVELHWGEDPKAFKYQIDVGYQAGGAMESYILDTPKDSFSIMMDRGAHYYFTMTRTNNNGQKSFKSADIEIPTCDDRDEFKAAHPDYDEPPIYYMTW